jgi:hypothetical protein
LGTGRDVANMIIKRANKVSDRGAGGRKLGWAACVGLLTLYAVFAVDAIRQHNLLVDEGGHVLAGLITWECGRVDVYPVNPPLIKVLASLPLALANPEFPDDVRLTPSMSWSAQQKRFLEANRARLSDVTVRPRYMVAALSIFGGLLVFRWSSQLFGTAAGLLTPV